MESRNSEEEIYRTLTWGILPNHIFVEKLQELLEEEGKVMVELDKNYPAAINSESYKDEMDKVSGLLEKNHEFEFVDVFKYLFRTGE